MKLTPNRIIVALLAVNALLFAYFQINSQVEVKKPLPDLHSDKIKLLSESELAVIPSPEPAEVNSDANKPDEAKSEAAKPADVVEAAPKLACYEWGSFPASSLPKAKNILSKLSLSATVKQHSSKEATRYWVYIPPKASLQLAQEKVDELRALGLDDLYIVQEPRWRNAISLGVYKDEALANSRLEDIKSRGVVTAVKAPRNQESGQVSLRIVDMLPSMVSEIKKSQPEFPGSEIKAVDCH